MTKSEFVAQVAARSGLSQKDAASAVDAALDTIQDTLARGGEVTFSGFGKFTVSDRSAREGINPATRREDPDRRDARPALQRRLRPEEGSEGLSFRDRLAARGRRAPILDRPRARPRPAGGSGRRRPTAAMRRRSSSPTARPSSRPPARRASRSSRRSRASSASALPAGRRSSASSPPRARRVCSSSPTPSAATSASPPRRTRRRSSPAAPGVDADALTVNPYLGPDTLEPFLQTGRGHLRPRPHLQPRRRHAPGRDARRRDPRLGARREHRRRPRRRTPSSAPPPPSTSCGRGS